MRNFKFERETSGRWYIVLPEWTGMKEDLEMVSGADEMLDMIAKDDSSVELTLSVEPFNGADVLVFEKFGPPQYEGGAYYQLDKYQGTSLDMIIWLCDVTKFVFDEFPDNIYFKKYEVEN
jgi:hypothetical protein